MNNISMANEDVSELQWKYSLAHDSIGCNFLSNDQTWTKSNSHQALMDILAKEVDGSWITDFYTLATNLKKNADFSRPSIISGAEICQKAVRIFAYCLSDTGPLTNLEIGETELKCQLSGQSIFSLLRFNPTLFRDKILLQLILYQIVCNLEHFHCQSVPHLALNVTDIYMDDFFRIQLAPPNLDEISKATLNRKKQPDRASHSKTTTSSNGDEFSIILQRWILNQISNYDYLMCLNRLAGRRAGDPTASAILPWVTDFSVENGGLRDLTRTKFRLAKGESQLDATFQKNVNQPTTTPPLLTLPSATIDLLSTGVWHKIEGSESGVAFLPQGGEAKVQDQFMPHHLLDIMPNLAFFTYKARRTPVDVLQRYVRNVYRPEEFPSNMRRLYESTPDECIPEFFTDSTVFASLHTDMCDLGLPDWCSSPDAFLAYHRRILESEYVSRNLHHWIDLTFGYKLLGQAAVDAKNVHLELVSSTDHLMRRSDSSVTCLFTLPHPRRAIQQELYTLFESKLPISGLLSSPIQFHGNDAQLNSNDEMLATEPKIKPPSLSEIYDETSIFLAETCGAGPPDFKRLVAGFSLEEFNNLDRLLQLDLEALGCLIVELSVHSTLLGCSLELGSMPHQRRLRRARQLLRSHSTLIPSGLQKGVQILLKCSTQHCCLQKEIDDLQFDWSPPPIRVLIQHIFQFPECVIDIHRISIGLQIATSKSLSRESINQLLRELHLAHTESDCSLLLNVFQVLLDPDNETLEDIFCQPECRHRFPVEALCILTPLLMRFLHTSCLINALVSGRLIQFYCAVGGKSAVENHILPMLRALYHPNLLRHLPVAASPYSRHFMRHLLIYIRPSQFLTIFPPILALGVVNNGLKNANFLSETEITNLDITMSDKCPELSKFLEIFFPGRVTPIELPLQAKPTSSLKLVTKNEQKISFQKPKNTLAPTTSVPTIAAAQDSIFWLANLLGPVPTGTQLIPHLLTALSLCYCGPEQLRQASDCVRRINRRHPFQPLIKSPLPMPVYASGRPLVGDAAASGALRCLERMASLYGVQVILEIYLPSVVRSVSEALATMKSPSRWSVETEANLISAMVFLHQFVTYLPAQYLMDNLQDPILNKCLTGSVTVAGRLDCTFPSGLVGRIALVYKVIDAIYVIGTRVGFEIVRNQLTEILQLFFAMFDRTLTPPDNNRSKAVFFSCDFDESETTTDTNEKEDSVYTSLFSSGTVARSYSQSPMPTSMYVVKLDRNTSSLTVSTAPHLPPSTSPPPSPTTLQTDLKISPVHPSEIDVLENSSIYTSSNRPAVLTEIRSVFSPELAYMAYIPFCRLAGGIHIENSLYNIQLIKRLVKEHAEAGEGVENEYLSDNHQISTDGENGRTKLAINNEYEAKLVASPSVSRASSSHVQGVWGEYFKTIMCEFPKFSVKPQLHAKRLVSLAGHTSAVRCIMALPSENSLVTGGQDRTVHVYSMSSARKSMRRHVSETLVRSSATVTSQMSSLGAASQSLITSCAPSLVFREHRRSVLATVFLPTLHLIASADPSTLLLWDPMTEKLVSTLIGPSLGHSRVELSAVNSEPAFLNTLFCGDESGNLLVVDHRVGGLSATVITLPVGAHITSEPLAKFTSTGFSTQSIGSVINYGSSGVAGAMRSLSVVNDDHSIICGFASGIMSAVDIRANKVVAYWRGHSDAVTQVLPLNSNCFTSMSTDRSIAFWRLHDDSLDCFRSLSHTQTTDETLSTSNMYSLPCAVSYGSSIVVAVSSSSPHFSIPLAKSSSPDQTIGSSVNGSLTSTMPGSNSICLGNYISTSDSEIGFRWFGRFSHDIIKGPLSGFAVLPASRCFAVGSTSGSLSIFY